MLQYNFLMCLQAWFPVMPMAYAYRSAVGGLYYLARDRPDLLFSVSSVKELSARVAHPTVTALQRPKKVIGYVKGTSTYAVVTLEPEGGQGNWKNTKTSYCVLESASDSDWSSNKEHRKSASAGIHLEKRIFHVWIFKDAKNNQAFIL